MASNFGQPSVAVSTADRNILQHLITAVIGHSNYYMRMIFPIRATHIHLIIYTLFIFLLIIIIIIL